MKKSKVIVGRITHLPILSDDKTSCLFRIDNSESPIADIVTIRATGDLAIKCAQNLKSNDLICVEGNMDSTDYKTLDAFRLVELSYPWSEALSLYRR